MSGPLSNPFMFKSATAANFYTHQISNSVRMVAPSSTSSSNARLTQTFSTVDSNVHFTLNFWIKRSAIEGDNPVSSARPLNMFTPRSGTSGSVLHEFLFAASGSYGAGDAFAITNTNTGAYILSTNNVFRDTSAWYNIHIQADLDNGTASEKLKIFINGTEASYNVDNRSSYSSMAGIVAGAWTIGDYYNYGYPIQSYLAQWAYVDGSTLAPTVFAEEKNGVWIPKDLSSGITWGNAGHLLMFQDSSALGDDTSGEGNDWTSSNLSAHDQTLDTPTNNFCTLNPLSNVNSGTLSEGNLKATASAWTAVYGTFEVPVTGSWYWEYISENHVYAYPGVQTITTEANQQNHDFVAVQTGEYRYEGTGEANTSSISTGDIIGFWVNDGVIKVYVNNSLDHTFGTNMASSVNAGKTFFPSTIGSSAGIFNFGQDGTFAGAKTAGGNADANGHGNFMYTPKGLALCTANMSIAAAIDPAETDDDYPQELFFMSQYTGNLTGRTITTENQPDLLMIRHWNTGQNWYTLDSSRGITDNKYILTNTTDTEATLPQANITSVGATSVGISSGTWLNSTGSEYQMWMWRANGGTTSTNTQGDTNSTVQVDPSGHFSIVLGTGDNDSWGNPQTFGHGLSAAPNCIIGKQRTDNADEWQVFFSDYGNASIGGSNAACNSLVLNSNSALYTNQSYKGWGGVMPTSTVFTLDGNNLVGNGHTFVCYCFANCEGYIKSGAYEGNGNADGTFVYTGFRPAFVVNKRVDGSGSWLVHDNARNPHNVTDKILIFDGNDAEFSGANDKIDMLSNGFKIRSSNAGINGSGNDYVYLAFAKNPFKYATAR